MKDGSLWQRKLLSARDYRSFLKFFFEKTSIDFGHRPLSYHEFATRAGFKSKSFLNEVILGRKRLTPASIDKVKLGLKLNKTWSDYFQCMVATEEPDFQSQVQDRNYFEARQRKLARLISTKLDRVHEAKSLKPTDIYLKRDFPDVFASVGSVEKGADLESIEQRSKVERKQLLKLLGEMTAVGLIEKRGERYFPISESFDLDDLASDRFLREDFSRAVDRARRRIANQACEKSTLFMTQTYSVSKRNLPAFRAQLADLLREFAELSENPEGDCVTELVVGFTHN